MVVVSRPDTMIAQSVTLFVLAGRCEIGGGYLVWLWLRDHRGVALGVAGGLLFVRIRSPAHAPNVVQEIACLSIDARSSLPPRR